jgi:hypothetical protein
MASEEVLRAIITARQSIARSMRAAASGTEELRDTMAATAASSAGLERSLDQSEGEANQFDDAIGDAARAATSAAIAMALLQGRIDEVGDEATESAAKSTALSAALQSTAASASVSGSAMAATKASMGSLIALLPVVIAGLFGVSAALAGVAAAAVAAGAALAGIFAGGLLVMGEQAAAANEDLEGTLEGVQHVLEQISSAAAEALAPLRRPEFATAATAGINAALGALHALATLAADLAPALLSVTDRLGALSDSEAGAFLSELEALVRDTLPALEEMGAYLIENGADALRFLRVQAVALAPELGLLAMAVIDATVALSELGVTVVDTVGPVLAGLLFVLGPLVDVFEAMPPILQAVTIGMATAVPVTVALTTAVAALAAALWATGIPEIIIALSVLAAAFGAVLGIIGGLISYFDLWGPIMDELVAAWNRFIEAIEYYLNLSSMMTNNFKKLRLYLGALQAALVAVGSALAWLGQQYETYLEPMVEQLLQLIGLTEQAVDSAGGISLQGAKLEQPTAGGSGASGAGRAGGTSASERISEARDNRREYRFDFSGASFGGDSSQRQIERAVEEALKKERSRSSDM